MAERHVAEAATDGTSRPPSPALLRHATSDNNDSEEDTSAGLDIFTEPADFRPATPPPSEATYTYPDGSGRVVRLSLLGSHPLWGHLLWNAATIVSEYLIQREASCHGKSFLELGAAAGLPSIVAHWQGANVVVATDYPDPDLMGNLRSNCERNAQHDDGEAVERRRLAAEGYIWGTDTSKLTALLPAQKHHFDVVIMSDLVFNHQAHPAMLDTLDKCLPPPTASTQAAATAAAAAAANPHDGPHALVFFSHHRPHKANEDMRFFDLARERGWSCVELGHWKMAPMFAADAGPEEVRSTIHGWQVFR